MNNDVSTAEERRLEAARSGAVPWRLWGPYLSERAWGTVREDYSADGSAWDSFPHDHARSRAYRWNEDGLAGISERHGRICFALALWNGKDAILKERLFGLTGSEGNHGEDVKEYYFYLDCTPTHSYMKYLYKYPQGEFPYGRLVNENRSRGKHAPEYELFDTGAFDGGRYWDVMVEYAKSAFDDILVRITATNRGPDAAPLHVLPTLWCRNTWSWDDTAPRPRLHLTKRTGTSACVEVNEPECGQYWIHFDGAPEVLFTENETNNKRIFGCENESPYVKDGVENRVIHNRTDAVNPHGVGTKCAAWYVADVAPGASVTFRARLSTADPATCEEQFSAEFDACFDARKAEADAFYEGIAPETLTEDGRRVMRQAISGLLWSKQYYHYVIRQWIQGDPAAPPPPDCRHRGRNCDWHHLHNADVISMPDKWEYPWYAAWDLAFHCVPLALVDSEFAKEQLGLMVREWYMHPNGQLPAYEWAFGDVNPPVHAWAAWRVYKMEEKRQGVADRAFLERVFHKLLLNFTWWVNRKDADGMNIFQGGFLGLDNIGVFDRSAALPTGGKLEQSDGTSWMAMYTLNLMAIALELARHNPAYEDVATKFWEHFLYIAHAMTRVGKDDIDLWDDDDGFFYDVLLLPNGTHFPLKVRSMVGLIPLLAVETLESEDLERFDGFRKRLEWFTDHRRDLTSNVACMKSPGHEDRRLLSVVTPDQLRSILRVMLDEDEFLSPYGLRAISRYHKDHPYVLNVNGHEFRVDYEPAESSTGLFGGNSNWRGPIWMPLNYLIIEALQKFHFYYGDSFKVEFPTRSGVEMNLWDVAAELSRRLSSIFLRDETGRRPVYGGQETFQNDPNWKDCILFHEYFHGDNGAGIGASHQTGWTALVAKLLQQSGAGL